VIRVQTSDLLLLPSKPQVLARIQANDKRPPPTPRARANADAAADDARAHAALPPPTKKNPSKQAGADDQFADYKPTTAFLFPGQGAQSVGMAKELCASSPAAKALFDRASKMLGYDLLQVCAEGPKEKLDTTAVSQPAIYVASLAAVEKMREQGGEGAAAAAAADVAAGLSLGEYTALAFAGAFSFEDGLKLVQLRGQAMQEAADAARSGMVSVIGLDSDKVAELCAAATEQVGKDKAVQIANYLCPGNYAVSGSIEGCEAVEALGKPQFKARMTVRLAVAGAFHTSYMQPAVARLESALADTPFQTPRIPVVSNVDAKPHSDPAVIKAILARQVVSPVQWETTVKDLLAKGVKKSYEVGPGKVIAGIVKRIDKAAEVENVTA
jgi:[acyl-carrier-protein] S-malonyltransferase